MSLVRALAVGVTFAAQWQLALGTEESVSYVEYKGQKVALARAYRDFDEYKNDPNNLSDASARYAAQLVTRVPFGPRFKNMSALVAALGDLQFPGYGYFLANQVGSHMDQKLELAYVELPRAGANRYLVTELQADGTHRLITDFIAPADPEIARVHRSTDGRLRYEDSRGKAIIPAGTGP